MIEHTVQVRVRYAETDQMGYVYYGNYATYFEVARVETFRHLGCSYKSMEAQGILMPVLDFKTKFIKPARYDDVLSIKVIIKEKPGVRITFNYEVYNEHNVLLNLAETTLVFINDQFKPTLPPDSVLTIFTPYFQS
ncbi:MAG: acyl-CoA thioesterase [Cytophagaceae bacterium]|jgi:acyl-CoA thioester hydrolase|nr:acyl-CoA thioesterase [Cytophagaceae bacterium]